MVEVAMITGLFMRLLYKTCIRDSNEGMLVGEWVKLPTTEEEMQKVFERIGIGKQDEMCIRDRHMSVWMLPVKSCPRTRFSRKSVSLMKRPERAKPAFILRMS